MSSYYKGRRKVEMLGKCTTPIKPIEPKKKEPKKHTSLPVHPGCRIPPKCFIDTHSFAGTSFLLPGVTEQPIIEDFTCNHNKTLLILRSENPSIGSGDTAKPILITIRTRGGCPITVVIPPLGVRIFQVEDFESLLALNLGTGEAALVVSMQKTFCICCKDEKKLDRCK